MSEEFVAPLVVGWVGGDLGRFDPRLAGTPGDCPVVAWLVSVGGRLVLFDTGGGDPESAANQTRPHYRRAREDALERRLSDELGIQPGDLDAVVVSHLHWDHAGGLGAFPASRVYVQAAEVAYAASPSTDQRRLFIDLAEVASSHAWATSPMDLPGLCAVPLPGHTPGSQGLLVTAASGAQILLAGDAVPLASNLRPPTAGGIATDPTAAAQVVRRIVDMDALVLPSHDPLLASMDGRNVVAEDMFAALEAAFGPRSA